MAVDVGCSLKLGLCLLICSALGDEPSSSVRDIHWRSSKASQLRVDISKESEQPNDKVDAAKDSIYKFVTRLEEKTGSDNAQNAGNQQHGASTNCGYEVCYVTDIGNFSNHEAKCRERIFNVQYFSDYKRNIIST